MAHIQIRSLESYSPFPNPRGSIECWLPTVAVEGDKDGGPDSMVVGGAVRQVVAQV